MRRLMVAGLLYLGGFAWNRWLFRLGGVFGDWIVIGRWVVSIGDLLYLVAFSVILSWVWRSS